MRNLLLAYLLILLLGVPALSQVSQPARFEMELLDRDEEFTIIPAEEDGLFLTRKVKNEETKRDYKYQMIYLDTMLNKVWEVSNYIDVEYIFTGYDFIDPYLYFLFRHSFKSKKYRILRIEKETHEYHTFDIELDFDLLLTEFEVIDELLVFGGYVNNRPSFVCFKFGQTMPIVLPGFRNEPNYIMQLEMEEDKGIFNILTSLITRNKRKSINIKSYNSEGSLLKDFELQPQSNYSLIDGRSVALNENDHLVIGAYSQKKSDMSRGIFVAKVESSGDHVINYYNYADLKNFFNYMKARKEIRVKKRIERRKIKGKKNKFFYRLLVHDIVEHNDQYIMIGEAFYPKYSYGPSSYYNPAFYNNRTGTYFEGYSYTHAVVIGFDKNGRIIWDNSFEIDGVVTMDLKHFVHVMPTGDGAVLLYIYDGEIRSKIIKGTQVLDVMENNDLRLSHEEDRVSEEKKDFVALQKWYAGNLYAYGVHKLVNYTEKGVIHEREVFFINKIALR